MNGAGPPGELSAEELVVALERTPNTSDIGLDRVGLAPGARLPTGHDGLVHAVDGDWLYAVCDVTGHALLTHMGKYQARTAAAAIVARAGGELTDTPLPWSARCATAEQDAVTQVIFTSPQVAAVGLTEGHDDPRAAAESPGKQGLAPPPAGAEQAQRHTGRDHGKDRAQDDPAIDLEHRRGDQRDHDRSGVPTMRLEKAPALAPSAAPPRRSRGRWAPT
jgi:hypothetical protein